MVDVRGNKPIVHTMQFVCDECFITATLNRAFKFHMKKHHPIPYVCELCEFTSSELTLRKQHVDTTHMNQKLELYLSRIHQFRCHDCTFTSTHKSTLAMHAKSEAQALHPCHLCGITFAFVPDLESHI